MKLIYCLLLLLCSAVSNAQPTDAPLSIGQQLPTLRFNNMYNYVSKTMDVKAGKAKLILLDFWATTCGNCISKFALLDSMKLANKQSLEVILVNSRGTNDDLARIQKLFTRLNSIRGTPLSLPVAVDDIKARQLFPHKYIPHYVWLSQDLQVMAITGGETVTAGNINAALAGDYQNLADEIHDAVFDIQQPFLANTAVKKEHLLFSSSVTAQIPGLASSSYTNESGGYTSTMRYSNASLNYLLFYAYNTIPPKNTILWETAAGDPFKNQRFCYELITSSMPATQARTLMQQDLQRYFGIRARQENRLMDTYILKADTVTLNKYLSKGGLAANTLRDAGDRRLQNQSLESLRGWLDKNMELPVLDETGYTRRVDISFPEPVFDFSQINNLLLPFGLSLQKAKRRVSCFIIY
ncbi:MAG: DUF3738 domain-containing protein [Rhizobacter sp.]|nr:DUF3738 domain-containing protein [Ferruginibacter sp.]